MRVHFSRGLLLIICLESSLGKLGQTARSQQHSKRWCRCEGRSSTNVLVQSCVDSSPSSSKKRKSGLDDHLKQNLTISGKRLLFMLNPIIPKPKHPWVS